MPAEFDNEIANAAQYTRDERIQKVLQFLRIGRISLLDCILDVLDPSKPDFAAYRKLFLSNPSGKLARMLDLMFEDDRGRTHLLDWMEPHVIDLLCTKISDEMDDVKRSLGGTLGSITPDTLRTWDVKTFVGSMISERAPITGRILQTAAQTDRAKQKNKVETCSTACNVIITQLAKERSQLLVLASFRRTGYQSTRQHLGNTKTVG